jgi:hypothetical protein
VKRDRSAKRRERGSGRDRVLNENEYMTALWRRSWSIFDLGFEMPFKTITGGIFEVGYPDLIQQMWAAFLMEREGGLDGRFGCATPAEAVQSQRIFAAALASHTRNEALKLSPECTAE